MARGATFDYFRILCIVELSAEDAPMSLSTLYDVALGLLALVGAAAIAIVLMLAWPVRPPPPLASIHAGAREIDETGAPDFSRFQARDGTWLAYRVYPAQN